MSYCKTFGKDKVVFVTKEEHESQSSVTLPDDPEDEARGLILPNGEINWDCPCLGGMATGPCGPEFREAFSCFHYSKAEPKGSDCIDNFQKMQECMTKFPSLYPMNSDDDDDKDEIDDNGDSIARVAQKIADGGSPPSVESAESGVQETKMENKQ